MYPDRHPYPVKCALYIATFVCPVPWSAVHAVLATMGYISVRVSTPHELDLWGEKVTAHMVTIGWTRPDTEPLYTDEDIGGEK